MLSYEFFMFLPRVPISVEFMTKPFWGLPGVFFRTGSSGAHGSISVHDNNFQYLILSKLHGNRFVQIIIYIF